MANPFKPVYDSYRTDTQLDFPCMVDIELTNCCNLKCKMCPTGNGSAKRKRGYMSGNVFRVLLKELERHKTPVRFVRWGEPTLHPNLYDWISECKEAGLLTHMNTNGALLDIEEVLDCGLDSIKFSIHEDVSELTRELYKKKPRPYMTLTGYEGSTKGCAGDEITIGRIKDLTKPPKAYSRCSEVLAKLSINWDGTISACCSDYDNLMLAGDIKNNTLEEIWNGRKMRYYRRMLKNTRHAELPLCKNCDL